MKKKIILASLFAAVLALALPMMAFAAESPTNTQTKTQAGVTATLVGSSESIDNLVIESASASNTVSGALGSQTLLGDYNVYFTDGKTSDFGTLTLSLRRERKFKRRGLCCGAFGVFFHPVPYK